MELAICLDTDVAIAILNDEPRLKHIQLEGHRICISAITLFELLLRRSNLEAVEEFRRDVTVLGFTEATARRASEIFKTLERLGRPTEFRDLLTAAIAVEHGCSLATFNHRHFEHIPGVKLL